jgi:competence protein ComEC
MSKRKKLSIIIILLIITIFYYRFEDQSNLLRVCFLNVGQGDSILIKSPQGKNILIDGGPNANLIHQLGNKHSYQNHKIDILIITHSHTDHYIGLIEVVKRYDIKLILWSGVNAHNSSYLYFKKLTKNLNTEVALLGQEYLIEKDLKIKILYPIHHLSKEEAEDMNNTSVSLILSYREIDFFLAGDLTCEGEKEIIKQNLNIEAEIYKASHHGSRWSNCNAILDKLKPELAIIQSGLDNKFKHPHLETLERLEKRSIQILRNDELGDIWIESDGEKYWVKN